MAVELCGLFNEPEQLTWQLAGAYREGPPSLSQQAARARLDGGGWWQAKPENIFVRDDNAHLWHAVEALVDDGVDEVILDYITNLQPWPSVDGTPLSSLDPIPHSDGSFFSDGSGYMQRIIIAELDADAALRATTLRIDMQYSSPLVGGEPFTIVHPTQNERMYRVGTAVQGSDGIWTVTVRPTLREAAVAGTVLDFDRPRCRMTMQGGMALPLSSPFMGKASLQFIEA